MAIGFDCRSQVHTGIHLALTVILSSTADGEYPSILDMIALIMRERAALAAV